MPFVDETFVVVRTLEAVDSGASRPSSEVIHGLHAELAAVGLQPAETADGFGAASALALTEFQRLYRLPDHGNLDPTTGGVLALASMVATEEDPARLRARLAEARGRVANSPAYDGWLARLAVVAGAYDVAATAGSRINDLWGRDFGSVLDAGRAPEPEVPFPENYYTYRYGLMAQETIDELRIGRTQGANGNIIFMRPLQQVPSSQNPVVEPIPPVDPPPLPPETPDGDRPLRLANAAEAWLAAVEAWQLGNQELAKRRYASAVAAYDRCQRAALAYFAWSPLYATSYVSSTISLRVDELLWRLAGGRQGWPQLWGQVDWRRQLLSLTELIELDWIDPFDGPPIRSGDAIYATLQANFAGNDGPMNASTRIALLDVRMLVFAAVLVPLARGEANRMRGQYAAAQLDFELMLRRRIRDPRSDSPDAPQLTVGVACERIEVPFARLLLMETLLDQAEAQYKARTRVEDLPEPRKQEALTRLSLIAAELEARQLPGDARPGALPLQHLVAAATYADVTSVFASDGAYAERARQALDDLDSKVRGVANASVAAELQAAARAITLPTLQMRPEVSKRGANPHEALVELVAPNSAPLREANPRVYALSLQAQARLLQIWSGFNYLGYQDSYTPPWRFLFLLERARYFVEHAKNAQRDYLNFLGNAESEELKELSSGQVVELEKANVAIETARVDQSSQEVAAVRASADLADLTARDARQRLTDYQDFDRASRHLGFWDSLGSAVLGGAVALATGNPSGLIDAYHTVIGNEKAAAERGFEKKNLQRSIDEAEQARLVAEANVEVARAGLVVAGLQRQAALLRHALALQTLQFMRNRSLNAEQWDRLATAIRGVAETYLRYGIELSFLAQQAYNFEADKRLDVIRFDYDVSDVGAMLAADFLLRDLDTLEQDHIVSQQARLQQLRYVVSLARDYPDASRALGEDGSVIFSVQLEQLERHFPGMVGLRVTAVEVLPLALMDPTRVSVELTQLGGGSIRLRQQAIDSPLDASDVPAAADWLGAHGAAWPIKVCVGQPASALFTGLSRQETPSLSAITANERDSFEGLPAASSWRIDLSTRENQIVPGTLADCLITFVVSGTYDPSFKDVVTSAASNATRQLTTRLLSTRRSFPDAYFSLVRYGRMTLPVRERDLTISGTPGELRNVAIVLPPNLDGPHLGRWYCRYAIDIDVAPGNVAVLTPLPGVTFTASGLELRCQYTAAGGPVASDITWDLGDRSDLVVGAEVLHAYARPGGYNVGVRLVQDEKLVEYRAAIAVSGQHPVTAPLVVTPAFVAGPASSDGTIPVGISVEPSAGVAIDCAAGTARGFSTTGSLDLALEPGRHTLQFAATRSLSSHFYSRQRYVPTAPVVLERGRTTTNRTFDIDGHETTSAANAFTAHVFGGRVLSPVDEWTFELPVAANPWFRAVTSNDLDHIDCSELADAVLVLELVERA